MNPDPDTVATPGEAVSSVLFELAAGEELAITVRGNCMRPLLADGERVRVRRGRRYWPGDVLAVRTGQDHLALHRMLGLYRRQGQWRYLTRGDDSHRADPATPAERVLGKVVWCEGVAGRPAVSLSRRLGCLLAFATLGLARLAESRDKR